MKKTGALRPIGDMQMPFNKIVVNPNDGYELEVLTTETPVKIYAGVSVDEFKDGKGLLAQGQLAQENGCKLGTVEINAKTLKQIGTPGKVILCLEGSKLLIAGG